MMQVHNHFEELHPWPPHFQMQMQQPKVVKLVMISKVFLFTLQVVSSSEITFLPKFATVIMSSCLPELLADTAFDVA